MLARQRPKLPHQGLALTNDQNRLDLDPCKQRGSEQQHPLIGVRSRTVASPLESSIARRKNSPIIGSWKAERRHGNERGLRAYWAGDALDRALAEFAWCATEESEHVLAARRHANGP